MDVYENFQKQTGISLNIYWNSKKRKKRCLKIHF